VKLRMKSILTGPKVHRSNRHIIANAPNVIERQTIGPTCIAIAMSTGEIALVGEPKSDRKTIAARFFHHLARITYGNNNPPAARCLSMMRSTFVAKGRMSAPVSKPDIPFWKP
jgi:hypothetical protein